MAKVTEARAQIAASTNLTVNEKAELTKVMDATEAKLQSLLGDSLEADIASLYGTVTSNSELAIKRKLVASSNSNKAQHAKARGEGKVQT